MKPKLNKEQKIKLSPNTKKECKIELFSENKGKNSKKKKLKMITSFEIK